MKFLDQNTSGHFGVPELVLMEQAAMYFVWKFLDILELKADTGLGKLQTQQMPKKRGIVFCGLGNNGADGIAIARLLNEKGICTEVCKIKDVLAVSGRTTASFDVQENIYAAYGYPICTEMTDWSDKDYDFVIDAIFGIGLSRALNLEYINLIDKINQIPAVKIAVDMPSGINADNGQVMEAAIKCNHTITFSFGKIGQFLWPGCDYAGKVHVVDMGITERSWLDERPSLAYLEDMDLQNLPKRPAHSNKGTFGKLLIVAGSTNMAGAACFAAKAAYRSGVGLVKVFTTEENRTIIQNTVPEALLSVYNNNCKVVSSKSTVAELSLEKGNDYHPLLEDMKWADAIVIGPGIGRSFEAVELVETVLEHAAVPVVFDADALNILSEDVSKLRLLHTECIVTPHLGEFSRLTKKAISEIQSHLIESAVDFAGTYGVICVLKDFRTITACSDGLHFLNLSGNNGMATGGSGDVLSGVIGALLAQGMNGMDAASYGVFIHGLAGDMARKATGTYAMMAGDLIESLKEVWKGIEDAQY